MNVRIESNFDFSVVSIQYSADGNLSIKLSSNTMPQEARYQYEASLGSGQAEERPAVSLLQYAMDFAEKADIKEKTRESYRHMCRHLETYGDITVENVSTSYLQGFIVHLQAAELKSGTVCLYFQKLACVLHEAYKNGLFDDRVLQRVRRPKRERGKKTFLTEAELKRLSRHNLPGECENIRKMFQFSCMTGLRFSDVQGLRWKDVKRNGKHIQLEFRQRKTSTNESLPLCAEAENLLRSLEHKGDFVFKKETNQKANAVIRRWCRAARIRKPVSFHSARHTFCVLLLAKDVPIYTVQQLMCHSDISSTKVYADLMSKTKAKAIRKIPEFTG